MSPEQAAASKDLDGRSDIYSLAACCTRCSRDTRRSRGARRTSCWPGTRPTRCPRCGPAGRRSRRRSRRRWRRPWRRAGGPLRDGGAVRRVAGRSRHAAGDRRTAVAPWAANRGGRAAGRGARCGRGVVLPDRPAGTLFASGGDGSRRPCAAGRLREPHRRHDAGLRRARGHPEHSSRTPASCGWSDPANVRETLARMGLPPDTRLGDAVAREVAERENTKVFVAGEVSRLGAGYQLTARVVQTADGAELLRERAVASGLDDVIAAVDRLGGQLRRGIGESLRHALARPPLDRVPPHRCRPASVLRVRAHQERPSAGLERAGPCPARSGHRLRFPASPQPIDPRPRSWAVSIAVRKRWRSPERAFHLRDRLPELERLLFTASYLYLRRDPAAEVAFRDALALDPRRDRLDQPLGLLLERATLGGGRDACRARTGCR